MVKTPPPTGLNALARAASQSSGSKTRNYPAHFLAFLRASALERNYFALRVQFLEKNTDFLLLLRLRSCARALLNLCPKSTLLLVIIRTT